jgi:RNA polymerase II-associated protein 1
MSLRGQRFVLDLSDGEDEVGSSSTIPATVVPSLSSAFIGDIKEHSTAPPTAPQLKSTPSGFPEHKKRTRVSAFKQQRGGTVRPTAPDSSNVGASPPAQVSPPATGRQPTPQDPVIDDEERRRIDEENNQRLAAMSAEEIDEERQELVAGLSPSLIERLLKRANLDQGRGDTGIDLPGESHRGTENEISTGTQEEDGAISLPKPAGKPVSPAKGVRFEDDDQLAETIDVQPASSSPQTLEVTQPAMHFPTASAAPELDPSDPSFLENLHSKYFPSLPADPSKLAWMAPIPTHGSIADQDSPYYPNHESLPASALRFDFRGGLLPPRIARAIPSTKGLHHHGEAPEAAGYTVPELARLARSAFPAQRCVAFQTLGRFLYRLGRGEWGDEDSEISKGLWRCVEEGRVIETLEEAAASEGGHQGSKVYAVEAVWLWQKGGGKRWKAA